MTATSKKSAYGSENERGLHTEEKAQQDQGSDGAVRREGAKHEPEEEEEEGPSEDDAEDDDESED